MSRMWSLSQLASAAITRGYRPGPALPDPAAVRRPQRRRFLRGRGAWVSAAGLTAVGVAGVAAAGRGAGVLGSSASAPGAGFRAELVLAADRGAGGVVAARVRPGARIRLSLPLSMARIGVATKIEEYEPASRPTSSA